MLYSRYGANKEKTGTQEASGAARVSPIQSLLPRIRHCDDKLRAFFDFDDIF